MRTPLALLLLAAGCDPHVSGIEETRLIDCIDEDGDGHPRGLCELEYRDTFGQPRDCDDGSAWRAPSLDEIPYDGLDNDCATEVHAHADGDLLDVDGDGFAGVDASAYLAAFPDREWPSSLPVDRVDCDDTNAAVHPGRVDAPYDGVDADCAGDDDFDADGDGFSRDEDCDDTSASVHPGAVEDAWYDGIDRDCAGDNDYDADADGYMPDAVSEAAFAAYVDRYGYELVARYGDCDDLEPSTHPGADDPWYDGVDSDCAGDDDFDADADGFAVDADCDDASVAIRPGTLEVLGDGVDQDCDGGADTSAFALDGHTWRAPRAPVVLRDELHYLLLTAAARFDDDVEHSVLAWFAPDAGPTPLGVQALKHHTAGAVSAVADSDRIFTAGSYAQSGRTYLFAYPWTWNGSAYETSGIPLYQGISGSRTYLDLDMRRDADGTLDVVGCDADTVHLLSGLPGGSASHARATSAEGGDTCSSVPGGVEVATASGLATYTVDGTDLVLTGTDPTFHVWGTASDDGVRAFAGGRDGFAGVTLDDGSEWLSGHTVALPTHVGGVVDVAVHGDLVFLAAIVDDTDGDGLDEVLLSWGEHPAAATEVRLPYAPNQQPTGVSVHVDDDRVFLAVSALDTVGDDDTIGWVFLAPPE